MFIVALCVGVSKAPRVLYFPPVGIYSTVGGDWPLFDPRKSCLGTKFSDSSGPGVLQTSKNTVSSCNTGIIVLVVLVSTLIQSLTVRLSNLACKCGWQLNLRKYTENSIVYGNTARWVGRPANLVYQLTLSMPTDNLKLGGRQERV